MTDETETVKLLRQIRRSMHCVLSAGPPSGLFFDASPCALWYRALPAGELGARWWDDCVPWYTSRRLYQLTL